MIKEVDLIIEMMIEVVGTLAQDPHMTIVEDVVILVIVHHLIQDLLEDVTAVHVRLLEDTVVVDLIQETKALIISSISICITKLQLLH